MHIKYNNEFLGYNGLPAEFVTSIFKFDNEEDFNVEFPNFTPFHDGTKYLNDVNEEIDNIFSNLYHQNIDDFKNLLISKFKQYIEDDKFNLSNESPDPFEMLRFNNEKFPKDMKKSRCYQHRLKLYVIAITDNNIITPVLKGIVFVIPL